jgi:hypothetical protein
MEGCLSFGNGCQPIEIVDACFDRFFQMRLEIVELSADFDSAIRIIRRRTADHARP